MNKKGQISETTGRVLLIGLVVVLILFMVASFQSSTQAIINLDTSEKVRGGEINEYFIDVRTVNPEQFTTSTHYREQFGTWILQDSSGETLAQGQKINISGGIYNIFLDLEIPKNDSMFKLIAQITEQQFSASSSEGPFISSNETLKKSEFIEIEVLTCTQHSQCNEQSTCLGQTGYCTDQGLCEVVGECTQCNVDSDCVSEDAKDYQCVENVCEEVLPETFINNIRKTFTQSITETPPVEPGQPLQANEAPPLLSGLTILMFAFILIYYFRSK